MQNLLRAAAEALAHLADKAHLWADDWAALSSPIGADHEFAGVDFVGIDFSTSIQQIATHVMHGWDRYRQQMDALRPNHGVWAFGVNALPFPLTRRPLPARLLPSFRAEQFRRRGQGRGLVEYGSAFYDYFLMVLGHVQELGVFDKGHQAAVPITISLLCDGFPNGGVYRAEDVRPPLAEARTRGVRFKLVCFAQYKYRDALRQFRESLGLSREELEIVWYDEDTPTEHTIHSGFDLLSHF